MKTLVVSKSNSRHASILVSFPDHFFSLWNLVRPACTLDILKDTATRGDHKNTLSYEVAMKPTSIDGKFQITM